MISNLNENPFYQNQLAGSQGIWQQNIGLQQMAGLQSQSAQSFGLGLGLGGMGMHTYVMSTVQEMQREVDDVLKGWDK
jgi:hypothetical protein